MLVTVQAKSNGQLLALAPCRLGKAPLRDGFGYCRFEHPKPRLIQERDDLDFPVALYFKGRFNQSFNAGKSRDGRIFREFRRNRRDRRNTLKLDRRRCERPLHGVQRDLRNLHLRTEQGVKRPAKIC